MRDTADRRLAAMAVFRAEGDAKAGVFIDFVAGLTCTASVHLAAILVIGALYAFPRKAAVQLEVTDLLPVADDAVIAVCVLGAADVLTEAVTHFVTRGTDTVACGRVADFVELFADDRLCGYALVGFEVTGFDAIARIAVITIGIALTGNRLALPVDFDGGRVTCATPMGFIAEGVISADDGFADLAGRAGEVAGFDAIACEPVIAVRICATARGGGGDLYALVCVGFKSFIAAAEAGLRIAAGVVLADDIVTAFVGSVRVVVVRTTGHKERTGE